MFSSTNSTINPFPNLSSSPYSPSPYINDHETNGISLYNDYNPLTTPFLPTYPPIAESELNNLAASSNAMMSKQDNPSHFLAGKRPAKKDRHSKIYTAQGFRDRRVRLSIEIARKFFYLQDMLGFDKASKTVDWLLTKSKKSIKELALNGGVKSLSSTSVCAFEPENGGLEERESFTDVSDKNRVEKLQRTSVDLARESRAKARARARERTRVKISSRKLQEDGKELQQKNQEPICLNQSRSLNHHQSCEKSAPSNATSSMKFVSHNQEEGPSSLDLAHQVPRGNIVEESIVIKRKLKPSASTGYQQNFLMLKDENFNSSSSSSNSYLPNLAQNWDIGSAIARSSFYTISNLNLSTELQVLYGKQTENS